MNRSRRHKAPKIPKADWELHHETIEQLYVRDRRSINSIIDYMAKSHQFSATKSQYEGQLRKWGIRVNKRDSEWQSLILCLLGRPNSGRGYEVRFNGRLIPAETIAREMLRRKITATVDAVSLARAKIPNGFTIHSPPNEQSTPDTQQAIVPELQWGLIGQSTDSRSFLASTFTEPTYSDIGWQRRYVSLGVYEPQAWTHAIDWSFLTSILQRKRDNVEIFGSNAMDHESVFCSSLQDGGQLINRDSAFLEPRYLLSSLLNGIEPSEKATNTQLHQVLRAIPKSVVLGLFRQLASPSADILRERVFASALDAGDAETVKIMLELGLDPCERISFDSNHTGSRLPLERALYRRGFSVCKAIVTHLCRPCLHSVRASAHNKVLRQLLSCYYELVSQFPPLTSSEWGEFVDLIHILLLGGARVTNECFFVTYFDQSLTYSFIELDPNGVNGWIKRGLLSSRWPDAQHRSSAAKQIESQQVHWMLNYVLYEQRMQIAKNDKLVVDELLRALETAVKTGDPRAIFTIIEACSRIGVELDLKQVDDPSNDFFKPCLEKNWESAQTLVEEQLHRSPAFFLSQDGEEVVDHQICSKKSHRDSYESIARYIAVGGNTEFTRVFEQYQDDIDLRHYLRSHESRLEQKLFKAAIEQDQLGIVVMLFQRLTFEYPRKLEINWPLAHILQKGDTAAIDAILCDSEPWAAALSLTLEEPPTYFSLEDLMYRVQDTSPFRLSRSNAHQQIALRCICYHVIHTSNESLLKWLVDNGLDMDEFSIFLDGEMYQVSFENMHKTSAYSGLMPNTGRGFPVHILPSILSIAAMQNNVPMTRLLVDLGAEGRDSMALARAVENDADVSTIEALLEGADLESKKRRVRHYGSAALRGAIRQRNYELLKLLAKQVDINGIELLPSELSDPRSAEPLSPLGEAILAQDDLAIGMLLDEGCDPQALVCYDGFPKEHQKGAHLNRLSPLLAAIDLNNLRIVQILVEKKAVVAPGPIQGLLRSPLQRAAEVGCFEIVIYLLSQDVPVDDPPFHSGGTPLQLAALSGHIEIAELLIENGANPDHPRAKGDGRTAFEAAAEWGRADVMSMLVKRGADLDLKFGSESESQYCRALRFAEEKGYMASKRYAQGLYEAAVAGLSRISLMDPWTSVGDEQSIGWGFVESDNVSLFYGDHMIDSSIGDFEGLSP